MPAVTQLTPNFLGGVSRQNDDKKLEGQVVDIINGYPDPTYGLVKRASSSFLFTFAKKNGTEFTGEELSDAFWFFVETQTEVTDANKAQHPGKEVGDIYRIVWIACIKNDEVYIWNSATGASQTVINEGKAYLTRPDNTYYDYKSYHSRTILDTVIICNRNKRVKMVDNKTTFNKNRVGTVRLEAVLGARTYRVRINNTDYSYTSAEQTSADAIIDGLIAKIPGTYNPQKYKTSIELSAGSSFTLSVSDNYNNKLMTSYQDTVNNESDLANPSKPGRLVEVVKSPGTVLDNFYLKYVDGVGWQEAVNPSVDVAFDDSTMPHSLVLQADGSWKFAPINWIDRLVGDDDNNKPPTFVGNTINASFFYNNRLGFLSEANVILSAAKDVYNFFNKSQLAALDSDPIDVNCNSTKPVELHDVVVQAQGVLLFGVRQQFWMSAPETGALTPTRTVVQSISNYESDVDISPIDFGTNIGFVSKSADYSKLMLMQGQGSNVDPIVVEISKVVTGWLPNTVNHMAASSQNSLAALTGVDDRNIYMYKFYNDGREDVMQAWTKWEMPGEVQYLAMINEIVFAVTKNGDRYTSTWVSVNTLDQSGPQLSEDEYKPGGPQLDFLSSPKSIVYSAADRTTKFYTKFPLLPDKKPTMVLTLPVSDGTAFNTRIDYIRSLKQLPHNVDDDPGYWAECEQGTDDNGTFFSLKGNFTEYDNGIQIGYPFKYEVVLPKIYYRLSGDQTRKDYTASLIINRIKFAVGLTGAVEFKIKAMGRDEWTDIQHVTDANYYEADTDPIKSEQQFTVPVNQRNKYFQLKVTSELPFPVSLVPMMWEGQYTPRFYGRS